MITTRFGGTVVIVAGCMEKGEVCIILEDSRGTLRCRTVPICELKADGGIHEIQAAIERGNKAAKEDLYGGKDEG